MLPAVSNIADALTELLADPEIQQGVADLGREIGDLFSKENVKAGAKAIGDVFRGIREAAPAIKGAIGTVADVLGKAVGIFQSLPPDIQKLLIGGFAVNKLTGGLVTNIAGGIFGALKAMTVQAGVVNVTGGVVNGGPGAAGGAGSAIGVLPIAAIAAAAAVAAEQVTRDTNKQLQTNFTNPLAGGIGGNIVTAIHNLTEVVRLSQRQQAKPGTPANASGSPDERQARRDLAAKTAEIALQVQRKGEQTVNTVLDAKSAISAAQLETKRETARGASLVQATTRSSSLSNAAIISGAIARNRPITNVSVNVTATHVTKAVTIQNRYGPGNGSYGTGPTSASGV